MKLPPELKLGLTAAGILALFVALAVWLIRDWIREREKRKRREAYNLWFNRKFIASLAARGKTLARCRRKLNLSKFFLHVEMQSDEYRESLWQKAMERTDLKIDGYYYYEEDK